MDEAAGSREAVEHTNGGNALVRCGECRHFEYFKNERGHNSPQAYGRCLARSWDGSKGQWPMFMHHCPKFERAAGGNSEGEE